MVFRLANLICLCQFQALLKTSGAYLAKNEEREILDGWTAALLLRCRQQQLMRQTDTYFRTRSYGSCPFSRNLASSDRDAEGGPSSVLVLTNRSYSFLLALLNDFNTETCRRILWGSLHRSRGIWCDGPCS
ncbi:hypothetical protein F5Y18DRAFT_241955 [Xylariaceae sp. FL1019]|nr:hypothetical protein F5Y18DRAFT_241955 [Xylariaceae sp. FL1019]